MIFTNGTTTIFEGVPQLIQMPPGTTLVDGLKDLLNTELSSPPDLINTSSTGALTVTNLFDIQTTLPLIRDMRISDKGILALYSGNFSASTRSVTFAGVNQTVSTNIVPAFMIGTSLQGVTYTRFRVRVWYKPDTTYIIVEWGSGNNPSAVALYQVKADRILMSMQVIINNTATPRFTIVSYGSTGTPQQTAFLDASLNSSYQGVVGINTFRNTSATIESETFDVSAYTAVSTTFRHVVPTDGSYVLEYSYDGGEYTLSDDASGASTVKIRVTYEWTTNPPIFREATIWGVHALGEETIALRLGGIGIRNAPEEVYILYNNTLGTLYGDGGFLPSSSWSFTPQNLQPKDIPMQVAKSRIAGVEFSSVYTPISDQYHTQGREVVNPIFSTTSTFTYTALGDTDV